MSYIRGDRKGKAAHELERKAMQDSFLSEALDGYDDADVQDTDKRLFRLQERVSRRTRKRRIPIYGAVAAVLLLSLSVSIYLFTRYELPDEELAVLAESRTVDTLSIMMPAGNMEQIGKQESPVVADAEPVRSKKSQKKEMVAAERKLQTVSDMADGLEESIVTVDEKRDNYSSRRKIATRSAPRTTAHKLIKTTANTLTFTPPAVDCVPPPIIISTTMSNKVCVDKEVSPTLAKPAVRGQEELKKACTHLSATGMPAKEWFHSRAAMANVPPIKRKTVATSTIFVFKLYRCTFFRNLPERRNSQNFPACR